MSELKKYGAQVEIERGYPEFEMTYLCSDVDPRIAALKAEVINHKERRLKEGLISAAADMHPYAIEARDIQIAALRDAARDALAGWRYIRATHGDLYGVGWDRVEEKLSAVCDALDSE